MTAELRSCSDFFFTFPGTLSLWRTSCFLFFPPSIILDLQSSWNSISLSFNVQELNISPLWCHKGHWYHYDIHQRFVTTPPTGCTPGICSLLNTQKVGRGNNWSEIKHFCRRPLTQGSIWILKNKDVNKGNNMRCCNFKAPLILWLQSIETQMYFFRFDD